MIQRIQSIFFFLSSASFGGLFALPLATSPGSTAIPMLMDGEYLVTDSTLLTVLTILGGVLALVAIFLYKNRTLQVRLGYLVIVLGILVPVFAYLQFTQQTDTMAGELSISRGLGMALPVLALLFAGLANYFVRKDEKLIRSMDRLR